MPINYDGVYELRFLYNIPFSGLPSLVHQHTVDVRLENEPAPGENFDTITALNWNGTSQSLYDAVVAYFTVIAPFYNQDVNFPSVELWKFPPEETNATFVSALALNEVGSGTSAAVPAQQLTVTLRTVGGGIMRVQLMQVNRSSNARLSYPIADAELSAIRILLTGTAHPFAGRDDSRPLVALRASFGQNEKLWRKIYRP